MMCSDITSRYVCASDIVICKLYAQYPYNRNTGASLKKHIIIINYSFKMHEEFILTYNTHWSFCVFTLDRRVYLCTTVYISIVSNRLMKKATRMI